MIVIHLELRERRAQNLYLHFGRGDTRPQAVLIEEIVEGFVEGFPKSFFQHAL
jgi:hypothetical protein